MLFHYANVEKLWLTGFISKMYLIQHYLSSRKFFCPYDTVVCHPKWNYELYKCSNLGSDSLFYFFVFKQKLSLSVIIWQSLWACATAIKNKRCLCPYLMSSACLSETVVELKVSKPQKTKLLALATFHGGNLNPLLSVWAPKPHTSSSVFF